jgi:aromatic ring-cleaving dioxygenase
MNHEFDETEEEVNERVRKQIKGRSLKKLGRLKDRKVTKTWSLPTSTVSKLSFLTKHFGLERDSLTLTQVVEFVYENRKLIKRIGE